MDFAIKLLGTYSGRDRTLRTLGYTARFIAGMTRPNGKASKRFSIFASEMSQCRTLLRLFDDLPMLQYTLSYGLGKKEEGPFLRLLNVIINCVDQLYYPLEHIAWASDKKLISVKDSSGWWNASTAMWAISLYLNIIKSWRTLFVLHYQKRAQNNSSTSSGSTSQDLTAVQVLETLSLIAYCCDFCNALHWLNVDFKPFKNMKQWQVGFLGLISSLIGVLKMIRTARLKSN